MPIIYIYFLFICIRSGFSFNMCIGIITSSNLLKIIIYFLGISEVMTNEDITSDMYRTVRLKCCVDCGWPWCIVVARRGVCTVQFGFNIVIFSINSCQLEYRNRDGGVEHWKSEKRKKQTDNGRIVPSCASVVSWRGGVPATTGDPQWYLSRRS